MTQYNPLNMKLSNSQLNKLKSGIKTSTEVTLEHSPNVVGDSKDETNYPPKLLLTNTQVSRLYKACAIIHQLIENYQKLNGLRLCNQEDFMADF